MSFCRIDAPATVRPRLEAARRITTFDEVTGGLDESTALFEARRYEIDYDYCKGCGLCAAECPRGAIEMEPEPF
jgi:Pyruvate/2-oxoacid:ferredoxin oxidoreductase delta subunit